ncbi:hypothetical protein PPL_12581 [Heterostelium album PN500]|uniref:Uncharacterized protein n=1 Tax=Heterostelium pallidum (strain ATCC 26659 / Pp 5 / PN500) TaxID=670386 RepID=D3BN06_HETP5|nr:hypothetical protein PPL_10090 [Heterostelium album PN500]XP_020429497.1 hypothetical protein PPL_12581 [Heterostelium album PN500]EFA76326.1 hypothetical protein PPL_10090 [Heterostelium album PN500]EFA77368.1 hypothetical protein PPL_12581 [Heterostelium album PN500]|eukprot:XP_020428458.1 hypothetical protein PPL_10090 [Heterostelium album PN500]
MPNAIDQDLQSLPSGVINTYLSQAEELVNLHKVIESNDLILSEIGDIKDMPETHITTQQLSRALYGINKDDINEDYINYIEALDDFMSSEAMFAQDMAI